MIAITSHAVDRYLDRINDSLTVEEAREHLAAEVQRASRLKARTKYGQIQYQLQDCVLVVKEAADTRQLVAVTVYPLPVPRGSAIPAREWEMALARAAERAHAEMDAREIPRQPPHGPAKAAAVEVTPTRLQEALADIDHALDRFRTAGAHMDEIRKVSGAASAAKLQRQVEHGARMAKERDGLKGVLRALGPHLPDTQAVRTILGEFLGVAFPERA